MVKIFSICTDGRENSGVTGFWFFDMVCSQSVEPIYGQNPSSV